MKEQMNVGISTNQNYYRYAYVMLTSLLENNQDMAVTVYVLHSELTEEQIGGYRKLAKQYGGNAVSVEIDKTRLAGQLPTTAAWTIEMYYRLMMPDILPEDVDRLLYLDVDMIVNASLKELYETDFEGKLFVACAEGEERHEERDPETCRRLFSELYEKGFEYFNSGMMLWHISEIRKKYTFADYMKAAELFEYTFAAPDQDLLNYCHWQEVKYVDMAVYNRFARSAHQAGKTYEDIKKEARIVHFAGAKPWNGRSIHMDIEQLWWDYAKKTPFFGELCEEMVYQTLHDPFVENYAKELIDNVTVLQKNLNESLQLNQQLLAMLSQPGN